MTKQKVALDQKAQRQLTKQQNKKNKPQKTTKQTQKVHSKPYKKTLLRTQPNHGSRNSQ